MIVVMILSMSTFFLLNKKDQTDTGSYIINIFIKIISNSPMSSATALVLVEMALEDTMEKEPMRTKKNWRKTIVELDDEIDLKQMLL